MGLELTPGVHDLTDAQGQYLTAAFPGIFSAVSPSVSAPSTSAVEATPAPADPTPALVPTWPKGRLELISAIKTGDADAWLEELANDSRKSVSKAALSRLGVLEV